MKLKTTMIITMLGLNLSGCAQTQRKDGSVANETSKAMQTYRYKIAQAKTWRYRTPFKHEKRNKQIDSRYDLKYINTRACKIHSIFSK